MIDSFQNVQNVALSAAQSKQKRECRTPEQVPVSGPDRGKMPLRALPEGRFLTYHPQGVNRHWPGFYGAKLFKEDDHG